jgi:hypothetical protein
MCSRSWTSERISSDAIGDVFIFIVKDDRQPLDSRYAAYAGFFNTTREVMRTPSSEREGKREYPVGRNFQKNNREPLDDLACR